jgi:hypothetical protein
MAPQGPELPDGEAAPEPGARAAGAADEALRRLEERLSQASEAAERLIAEAAASGSGGSDPQATAKPPPSGWQTPRSEQDTVQSRDLELLLQVVQSVRDLIPADLQRRLAETLRELLLALRALIDWYLERSEQRRSAASEVQDIPIL